MLLIEHRINTIDQLNRVSTDHGVEVDIRDYDGDLRLVHDPLLSGQRLDDFLAAYRHAFIVLNVKCDGIEERILSLLKKHHVADFFFLDVANPSLMGLIRRGIRQIAVRYSEYEPIEFALAFAGKVDWVWVDCFTRLPLDATIHRRLATQFKICIVSPELQTHSRETIHAYRDQLRDLSIDAVCSDYCLDWKNDV